MIHKNNQKEFWVTNVSNKNVSLRDLALTIPAHRSMNLLDNRHFKYTLEQLELSVVSGSIATKSDKIKVRRVAPPITIKPGIYKIDTPREVQMRSQVVIVERNLEDMLEDDESKMSDDKFALDFVTDEIDPKSNQKKKSE